METSVKLKLESPSKAHLSRVTFQGVDSAYVLESATEEDDAYSDSLMGELRSKKRRKKPKPKPPPKLCLEPTTEGFHKDPLFPTTLELEHAFKDPTLLSPTAKAAVIGMGRFVPTFDSSYGQLLGHKLKRREDKGGEKGKSPAASESPSKWKQVLRAKEPKVKSMFAQALKEASAASKGKETDKKASEFTSKAEKASKAETASKVEKASKVEGASKAAKEAREQPEVADSKLEKEPKTKASRKQLKQEKQPTRKVSRKESTVAKDDSKTLARKESLFCKGEKLPSISNFIEKRKKSIALERQASLLKKEQMEQKQNALAAAKKLKARKFVKPKRSDILLTDESLGDQTKEPSLHKIKKASAERESESSIDKEEDRVARKPSPKRKEGDKVGEEKEDKARLPKIKKTSVEADSEASGEEKEGGRARQPAAKRKEGAKVGEEKENKARLPKITKTLAETDSEGVGEEEESRRTRQPSAKRKEGAKVGEEKEDKARLPKITKTLAETDSEGVGEEKESRRARLPSPKRKEGAKDSEKGIKEKEDTVTEQRKPKKKTSFYEPESSSQHDEDEDDSKQRLSVVEDKLARLRMMEPPAPTPRPSSETAGEKEKDKREAPSETEPQEQPEASRVSESQKEDEEEDEKEEEGKKPGPSKEDRLGSRPASKRSLALEVARSKREEEEFLLARKVTLDRLAAIATFHEQAEESGDTEEVAEGGEGEEDGKPRRLRRVSRGERKPEKVDVHKHKPPKEGSRKAKDFFNFLKRSSQQVSERTG